VVVERCCFDSVPITRKGVIVNDKENTDSGHLFVTRCEFMS